MEDAGGRATGTTSSTQQISGWDSSAKGVIQAKSKRPSHCSIAEIGVSVVCRSEHGHCSTGSFRGSHGCLLSSGVCGRAFFGRQQHGGLVFTMVVDLPETNCDGGLKLSNSKQHQPGGKTSGRQEARTNTRAFEFINYPFYRIHFNRASKTSGSVPLLVEHTLV